MEVIHMQKELYSEAEMELLVFDATDIIVTSTTPGGEEDETPFVPAG